MNLLLAFLAVLPALAPRAVFYDDFNDGDISDWDPRCQSGSWYATSGWVHGSTGTSPAALVPSSGLELTDVEVSARASGYHSFGLIARLDDDDSGVIAYISPDADIARIRAVSNGQLGVIYGTMSMTLSAGTWYDLTFTCMENQLTLTVTDVITDQEWTMQASDPYPHSGCSGLLMGDEAGANWDWFEATGAGPLLQPSWLAVDDDGTGESSGDGNRAFEAGEEIELSVTLRNDGDEPITGVSAVLQSLQTGLVITDSYEEYPDIPSGGSVDSEDDFGVQAPAGTPEGTLWPMKLTVLADGGFDTELYFDLPLGNGMSDDLEDLPCSWTMSPVDDDWLSDWHRSSARNHTSGGGYSLKCGSTGAGDYRNLLYCMAVSEPFNASVGSRLEYWQWIDAELSGIPGYALDGGILQIGQFDQWYLLDMTGGYPYYIPEETTGPFEPYTSVYSGTFDWTLRSALIPTSLCGPLRLRYVFGSDDFDNSEGWYVDDISVQTQTGIGESGSGTPSVESLACRPNPSAGSVTFAIATTAPGGSVEVFDLTGRLVATVPFSTERGGADLQWGWTGDDGRPLDPGVYFARVTGVSGAAARLVRLAM